MDRIQNCVWNKLCEMSGEDVARAFTDYHGNQLMDEDFYHYLVDEGYMDDELGLNDTEDDDD